MKKNKLTALILAVMMLVPVMMISSGARPEAKYVIEEYKFDSSPRSLVISYYDGILSRGFAWYTDEKTEETLLYIAEGIHGADYDFAKNGKDCSSSASSSILWDDDVPDVLVRSHHAHVENLEAGKYYTYKLGGAGNFVTGVFKTDDDPTTLTVLNFNDPQTKEADKLNYFENDMATAFRTVGNVDFVLGGGDMYDSRMDQDTVSRYYRWGAAIDTLGLYSSSSPVMLASGNHETHTPNLYPFGSEIKYAGVMEENESAWYSFNYGSIHFAVLAYISKTASNDFKAEIEWLKEDLAAASADPSIKWKIVCTHWGPYTTGDHSSADGVQQLAAKLTPIVSENHVDLVLQAHDHTFSKTMPYLWDAKGHATSKKTVDKIVNFDPATVEIAGETYEDATKNGTYYVSCGASGHRIGENTEFAEPVTGRFKDAPLVIEIGKVTVDSPYAKIGDEATGDLNETMFGVLNIAGGTLKYDFYVATEDGEAVLVDTLRMFKGDDSAKTAAEELNSKILADKNSMAALASDYAMYTAASDEVKLLLSDEAKAIIEGYKASSDITTNYDKNAADKLGVIVSQKSIMTGGTQNIRFIATADKTAKSLAFDVKYYLNGKETTVRTAVTEAYKTEVTESFGLGFSSGIAIAEDTTKPTTVIYALTVTDVPSGAILIVTPVMTDKDGNEICGQPITAVAD